MALLNPSHNPEMHPSAQNGAGETLKGDPNTLSDLLSQPLETTDWDSAPENPYNWSARTKMLQVVLASSSAFTASIGTSLPTSARGELQVQFGLTVTQSILPLSLYVFALGLGPVVAGPLSETVGRFPVYLGSMPLGTLFTVGAALTTKFPALCFLRFMAGFAFAPSLAIGAGTLSDIYQPFERGLPSTVYVLMPFLGPGFGPVIGGFVASRKGWQWTQWTLALFAAVAFMTMIGGRETYQPVLKRRRAKNLGHTLPPEPPLKSRMAMFVTIALVRPIRMLFTEPLVGFSCLYTACEFATLFSFFAAVPYTFSTVYGFSTEQSGLVFISIIVGCLLGAMTVMICTVVLYFPQMKKHPPHRTPPEYRLYPAMIGSIGLPVALFWFAWTARSDVSWASPAVAIMPFAWGNICLFIAIMQYLVDTYAGTTVASAASANGLARYLLAGAFPLFTVQMYENLGIGWASSLLAFIAVALLPLPWLFFKWGKQIRAMSKFDTAATN